MNNEPVYLMTGVDCVLWVAVDKRVAAGQHSAWVCVSRFTDVQVDKF